MQPAFSSSRQAIGFCLLVGIICLLPAVAVRTGWFKIAGRYPSISIARGGLPSLQQEIFDKTNTVDVACVGSSRILTIDTPYLEHEFSEHLNRQAEVFTLGWNWSGFDILYFVARDLLSHRHVKMLVVNDETQRTTKPGQLEYVYRQHSYPHRLATYWYWRGQDIVALGLLDLPEKEMITAYGVAIIDTPRYLVDWARPSRPFNLPRCSSMQQFVANRGAALWAWGWGESPETFSAYDVRDFPATPADVVVYSATTRAMFTFTGPPRDAYAEYFAKELVRLCQEQGTKLVVLHMPSPTESQQATIPDPQCWPQDFGAPVELIGIPGVKLFAGRAPDEVRKLFFSDELHLNKNGSDLLTRLVTPTLFQFYDASTNCF